MPSRRSGSPRENTAGGDRIGYGDDIEMNGARGSDEDAFAAQTRLRKQFIPEIVRHSVWIAY